MRNVIPRRLTFDKDSHVTHLELCFSNVLTCYLYFTSITSITSYYNCFSNSVKFLAPSYEIVINVKG